MAEEGDYRLQHCPAELSEVSAEICPEVCQIVQEAFEKHYGIMHTALREKSIELSAVDDGLPQIFEPSKTISNAVTEPVQVTGAWKSVNISNESTRHSRRRSYNPGPLTMPGAFPSDPAEVDDASEPRSTYADFGDQDGTHHDLDNNPDQVQSSRLRPASDVSQSSASPSNYFSTIGSASSRTSVELNGCASDIPSPKGETPVKRGPRTWIKSTFAKTHHTATKGTDDCLACATEFPVKQLVVLTCSAEHKYCRSCFEQLVKSRCENESVFPPQCCQVEIPASLVVSKVSRSTRKMYAALEKTVSIAPDERWYCPYPRCLKAFNVSKAAVSERGVRCPHCRNNICVSCKQAAHSRNAECGDGALKATLLMSKNRGWQTCYKCGEMVELKDGCRHVKCRCKAEFCYVCSRKWPQCENNYGCVQKLEQIRTLKHSEGDLPDRLETELPIFASRSRLRPHQPIADAPRGDDGQVLADMTEEEQIAYAISVTLREAEEADTKRAIEESERAAAALAVVEFIQERERAESDERAKRRLARVDRRFRFYESEMQQVRTFQQELIEQRYDRTRNLNETLRLSSLRGQDMQWLDRMHDERLAILAEDRALLIQDPDFALHSYRRAARQQRTAEEGCSFIFTFASSCVSVAPQDKASQAPRTTQSKGESIMSRSRPPKPRTPGDALII